jgi:hypothetical protein
MSTRTLLVLSEVAVECGDEFCVACENWHTMGDGSRYCLLTSEHIENGRRTVGCHKAEKRAREMMTKTKGER